MSANLNLPEDAPLDALVHESSPDVLAAVAGDPRLTEDLALALLHRADLPREALEALNKQKSLTSLRKIQLAIVMHQHTPRHVSVPIIRHLYAFELMQVALSPSVPADVKRAAEEVVIGRMGSISSGERFTLSKRSSGRVAAALLTDKEERIMLAALQNPQMTEMWIVKALRAKTGTELLAPAVARHGKWSYRNDVRLALIANKNTPLASVVRFASELPRNMIKELLRGVRLSSAAKAAIHSALDRKK
ncbi:MAG: hypothetical protein ACHP79_02100 [Terriglobales bacterium]